MNGAAGFVDATDKIRCAAVEKLGILAMYDALGSRARVNREQPTLVPIA
jgi:hypothetical protein